MARSNSSAILVAPIFLRLALGVVFLWAGLGKFFDVIEVGPEDAAILANMGVLKPGVPPTPPVAPAGSPNTPTGGGALRTPDRSDAFRVELAAFQPDPKQSPKSAEPATPPAPTVPPSAVTPTPTPGSGAYVPSNFPEKTPVAMVNALATGLYHASHPGTTADNKPMPALWPRRLGRVSGPSTWRGRLGLRRSRAGRWCSSA